MAKFKFELPNGFKGFTKKAMLGKNADVYVRVCIFKKLKIGTIKLSEDQLRNFLENLYGSPIKIWR